MPNTNRILDGIDFPIDVRGLPESALPKLAKEVRDYVIDVVSETGGHLGAGLGVVELTVALHYVFETPRDILIWDVGHQCYPHKVLTGRKHQLPTLRQENGLSGFTQRSESEYDPFGAAHSSTSISAAMGYALARDMQNEHHQVIAVIGDGAMSAGMAFEALNNAGSEKRRLLVVLNDNDMSIARPVGAMSAYLSRLLSSRPYLQLRNLVRSVTEKLPPPFELTAQLAEKHAKNLLTGGTLFEELGFHYIGPVDGHRLDLLVPLLQSTKNVEGPILLHVVTEKGKGYLPAESSADKFHGVSKFEVATGKSKATKSPQPSYSRVFGSTLGDIAVKDKQVVAITAAMPSGTGLDAFVEKCPDRIYDVGIAEQHGVTFSAGLAAAGLKPFAAIYSTFLQRAYDQIVHDVAIQGLPVRFAIDRAGYVGADGATHAGSFDLTYLCCLPGFVVMAASDEQELQRMVVTAHEIDDAPSAFRFPRGNATGIGLLAQPEALPIGKGRLITEGKDIAVLSLGGRLGAVVEAARSIDHAITVADARFAKPLDTDLLANLAKNHKTLITIEEGAIGGFATQVMHSLHAMRLDEQVRLVPMVFPDRFIAHANSEDQYAAIGFDAKGIRDKILAHLKA